MVWAARHRRVDGAEWMALHVAPLGVAGRLRDRLFGERTVVMTSATLSLGGSFDAAAGAVGLPGTFLEGVALDLGEEGDGAGNQVSIDEIAPGGLPDGADLDHVYPVLAAVGGEPVGAGYVGVAKAWI